MNETLAILKSFNEKVERLERSGFYKKIVNKTPEMMAKFDSVKFEKKGDFNFDLIGKVKSWVPDYNEDEVEAVVLTYRILTQDNDRLSIRNLSKIYNEDGFPIEGKQYFNEARIRINEYLDSPSTVTFEKGWITIRSVMDVIIYGGLAHSNKHKEKIFKSWVNSGASGFFFIEFIATLKFMISYFSYFKKLNKVTIQLLEDNMKLDEDAP